MTWLTTWPTPNSGPEYAAHDTQQAAEAHAAEIVRSKRALVATTFWAEETQ